MQPFLHKNEGTVSRRGLHADAVHKGLHQGKAHARPLLIRLGGIKGLHGLLDILNAPPHIFNLDSDGVLVDPRAQNHLSAFFGVSVHNRVGHGLADGGSHLGNDAQRRIGLDEERADDHAGERLVLRDSQKAQLHLIIHVFPALPSP